MPERPGQVVESNAGIVASADPLATAAGVRMLEQGGNAVDAAVATGFALSVVEPSMSGIGGRAVALVRLPNGEFHGVDGMSEVPAGYSPASESRPDYGYQTIGIPGAVAAWAHLLDRFGTLPLDVVMQPAIELADDGFELPFSTVDEGLAEYPGASESFLKPDGTPYRLGERFRQPALARTLRRIAATGPETFYRGEIAAAIAADMTANGGFVSREDLAGYAVRPLRIVRGEYRGHQLVATGSPPSGYMLIEALQVLEHVDAAALDEPAWATMLCRALGLAREDRDTLPGPAVEREDRMLSTEWAKQRASHLAVSNDTSNAVGESADAEPDHTSHLSVIDADGMIVAMTQSLGPEYGSRVATPGLGFLYAVTMGSYKDGAPKTRPNLSQSPIMVLDGDDPMLVLGAAGGGRIPSAIVSVISRWIDRQNSFADAMKKPRVHTGGHCTRLEDSGAFSLIATLDDDVLTGWFESGAGEIFTMTGVRSTPSTGWAGDWTLAMTGATTHPYSDIGVQLRLRLEPAGNTYSAHLLNGPENPAGQPALPPWAADDVLTEANRLTMTFPARFRWTDSEFETVRAKGGRPEWDRPIARVHALYYDADRKLWTGMADPRGRGSAAAARSPSPDTP